MKRLERNLESTVPFVNSDFNDILQEQHRIAYSAYLDGINDMKYSTYSSNRGIILSGITIDANISTNTALETSIRNGCFDWTIRINKTNACVYFDGQYYTPADDLINESDDIYEGIYTNTQGLFIYPFTQSINDINTGVLQVRQYLHDTKGPSAGSYGSQSVTIDYRFQIIPYNSTGGLFWREYHILYDEKLPTDSQIFPGASQGVPYVLCGWGGTSRNLSRLLKLNATSKDDILISYDLKNWKTPASLTNILDGAVYRDFGWSYSFPQGVITSINYFEVGRNELKGFRGMTAIQGRFPVGYDQTTSDSPYQAAHFQVNYGTTSNIGGFQSLTFSNNQLPAHDHGGFTAPTTQNLDHAHAFQGGIPEDSSGGVYDVRAVGFGESTTNDPTEVFLTRSRPFFSQQTDENNIPEHLHNAKNHRHIIIPSGLNLPHENRPAYSVVLYYYKL